MYEAYFELEKKPFGLMPDHEFLYLSKRHALALSMLRYGVLEPSAGFVVVTGEIGSGKTTLVRRILDEVGDDVVVGLITNTHESLGNLLQWVLLSLGLEYKNKEPKCCGLADANHVVIADEGDKKDNQLFTCNFPNDWFHVEFFCI